MSDQEKRKRKRGIGLGKEKEAKGRRLFVYQGLSLEEIAEALGVKKTSVSQSSAHHNWRRLRDEFLIEQDRKTREAALQSEAVIAAECRRRSWSLVDKLMDQYDSQLSKKLKRKKNVTAFELQALVNTALALKNQVGDPRIKRRDLDGLSFQDLLQKAVNIVSANFVNEKGDGEAPGLDPNDPDAPVPVDESHEDFEREMREED